MEIDTSTPMRPVNPKRFILFGSPSENLCPAGHKFVKIEAGPETLQTFVSEGVTFLGFGKLDIATLVDKLEVMFGRALSSISYNISVKLPIGLLKPNDKVISIDQDNSTSVYEVVSCNG